MSACIQERKKIMIMLSNSLAIHSNHTPPSPVIIIIVIAPGPFCMKIRIVFANYLESMIKQVTLKEHTENWYIKMKIEIQVYYFLYKSQWITWIKISIWSNTAVNQCPVVVCHRRYSCTTVQSKYTGAAWP